MKFSIRDLLLVTVIVGLAVGWWVDHLRQVETQRVWQSRAKWGADVIYGNPDIEWPTAGSENFRPSE